MPFITVEHLAGLSDQRRRALQERLASLVVEHFAAPPSNVRVITRAVEPVDRYMADGNHAAALPIIRLEFLPGRSVEQKRAVVRELARAAAEILQVPVGQIRTVLYEARLEDWARGETLMLDA